MKHGKFAKFMSLCLALLLTAGMLSTTAFAAGSKRIGSDDKGAIQVSGAEDGLTVSAYKVMEVNFDYDNQQPVTPEYKWNSEAASWVGTNYGSYVDTSSENAVTEAFLNASSTDIALFYDKLAAAIRGGDVSIAAAVTGTTVNGKTELKAGMGSYLVLVENGMKVYRPSAVNLIPQWNETANEWNISTPAVVEMKSSEPALNKTINEEVSDSHNKEVSDHAGMGDMVKFDLRADIPNYPVNAAAKGYEISDTMSAGLTLAENSIQVYGVKGQDETELSIDTDYTLTTTNAARPDNKGNVTFSVKFDYEQVKEYEKVHIKYNAVLNENASIGGDEQPAGNPNSAYLDYNNNPYNAADWKSIQDQVTVFTYGIEVSKVDKVDAALYLPGAEFVLSSSEEESDAIAFVQTADGKYRKALTANGSGAVTRLVSGNSGSMTGKLELTGLDAGTYYLIETKAPEGGYIKLNSPVKVVIADDDLDGAVTVGDQQKTDGIVPVTIENGKGFTLPTTGGMGTILFTAGGILLMGCALVMTIVIRKRKIAAEK